MTKIDCTSCHLKELPICRAWRDTRVRSCLAGGGVRAYKRNTTLFESGDKPGLVGILKSGYLRKERVSSEGERTLVDMVFPGDVIGTFPDREANFTLEAATDSEICAIDAMTGRQLLNQSAPFRRGVVLDMNRQLTLVWLRGAMTGRERILSFFLLAAETMPSDKMPDGSVVVNIPVSRADWADLCSTTVESISRRVSELTDIGLVESLGSNRYHLKDTDDLRAQIGLESGAFAHFRSYGRWKVAPFANEDREPFDRLPLGVHVAKGARALPACGIVPV